MSFDPFKAYLFLGPVGVVVLTSLIWGDCISLPLLPQQLQVVAKRKTMGRLCDVAWSPHD